MMQCDWLKGSHMTKGSWISNETNIHVPNLWHQILLTNQINFHKLSYPHRPTGHCTGALISKHCLPRQLTYPQLTQLTPVTYHAYPQLTQLTLVTQYPQLTTYHSSWPPADTAYPSKLPTADTAQLTQLTPVTDHQLTTYHSNWPPADSFCSEFVTPKTPNQSDKFSQIILPTQAHR